MFARSAVLTRRSVLAALAAAVFGLVVLAVGFGPVPPSAEAQNPVSSPAGKAAATPGANAVPTPREFLGPSFTVPIAAEPPAKIIIDPPLPEELANGIAVIQYRTENLRILPVFGPAAVSVSPRIGHLHVRLDDTPWG